MLDGSACAATFYVCPGLFGGRHPDVAGEEGASARRAPRRRALHDAGMELGSHTLSHPDLRRLSDDELARELRDSKEAVEAITGEAVPHSWPIRTASTTSGCVKAVGAAGYELAFAWLPGPWRPLEAPRLPAPPRHGAGRLALKLLGLRRRGRSRCVSRS